MRLSSPEFEGLRRCLTSTSGLGNTEEGQLGRSLRLTIGDPFRQDAYCYCPSRSVCVSGSGAGTVGGFRGGRV